MTAPPPSIRLATADDLPRLHPVIERAYRGESARVGWTHEADLLDGDRTSLDVLEDILAQPNQRLLVAERDGDLIGCVAVTGLANRLAYLGQLCVEPRLQAAGIGRVLIDAAEDCARRTFGADRIEMTVIERRTELIAYYLRRGYAVTGERRDFPIPIDPPLFMTVLEKALG
ncbi:GNAT family N-acetyltransferase [Sphingomonas sp.]|uniref:GNAT family N-acetyltransferase n=1 Tax=Sphingomonas sp. TaxID=28214 RepID=UPI002C4C37C2|nr:GNAT family N-acetyltransferase [Sphingomonas sp.]HWK34951.1 GNAT family N-acetyltransferase [Sphingomonas sp.]